MAGPRAGSWVNKAGFPHQELGGGARPKQTTEACIFILVGETDIFSLTFC